MLEILATTNTLINKEAVKFWDVFETPVHLQPNRNNDFSSSTRTLHRGNGGIRTAGITNHGVMINGSRRHALIGKSTNLDT